jgi:hypothetical protein
MTRAETLISQIESDALDDAVPVSSTLRKCVALGGRTGSEQLRDWATRELQGYPGVDALPNYRKLPAPLRVDGISGNYKITREDVAPMSLPDFAREHISNEVPLTDGVGTLEAFAEQTEIKLMPQGASDLVMYMNRTSGDPTRHINALYWDVAPSAMTGVIDQIRTALVQLAAELRAGMGTEHDMPSAEEADQAVQVIVTGKRSKVNVHNAQAHGPHSTATTTAGTPTVGGLSKTQKIVGIAAGLATIAGAVFGAIKLF